MNGCRKGELSITIDHLSGSLTFETSDLFAVYSNVIPDGPKLQVKVILIHYPYLNYHSKQLLLYLERIYLSLVPTFLKQSL